MKSASIFALIILLLVSVSGFAQKYVDSDGKVNVAVVKLPYSGSRNVAELSKGPSFVAENGLMELLENLGCVVKDYPEVRLTPEEDKDYGVWHRLAMANGHLADLVAANEKAGQLNIGLLANCNGLLGMLGGFQHSGPGRRPLRIGLIWIDAHGDFNTPETTLSGMLGGMPVAVAAGMCLHRIRMESGLDPALPTRHIVMACVRDTDPLEQDLLDRSEVQMLSTADIINLSDKIDMQMRRLSGMVDKIYIHVDIDVLDPREVRGHGLTVPGGPTSEQLAAALTKMFKHEKASGFGIASYPVGRDENRLSLKAAYNLIEGVIKGVQARE